MDDLGMSSHKSDDQPLPLTDAPEARRSRRLADRGAASHQPGPASRPQTAIDEPGVLPNAIEDKAPIDSTDTRSSRRLRGLGTAEYWHDPLVWQDQGTIAKLDLVWLADKLHKLRKAVEGKGITPAWIEERAIVFRSAKDRDHWKKVEEDHTISKGRSLGVGNEHLEGYLDAVRWVRQGHGGKKCWIAAITGPFCNWVAVKNHVGIDIWHAVAVAVIQRPGNKGKILLVRDCDRHPEDHGHRVIQHIKAGPLWALYEQLLGKGKVEVLLHSDSRQRGKGRCLDITFRQIYKWAQLEDGLWDEEGEDPRLGGEGWQRLSK